MPALLGELKGSNPSKSSVETSHPKDSSVQMRARAMHTTVIIQRSWLKFDMMIWKPLFSVPIKFLGAVKHWMQNPQNYVTSTDPHPGISKQPR